MVSCRFLVNQAGGTPETGEQGESAVIKNLHKLAELRREPKILILAAACLLGSIASVLYFGVAIIAILAPIPFAAYFAYRAHVHKLETKADQLMEANRIHLATVEALATAIDARDQIATGHVRRTQIYAVGLGTKLELGTDEIEALRTGALLHDIGKLAVPDHILSKEGPLTPAEAEKAKIHPSVSAAILENIDFKHPVVATVRHHHEFWNGEGYPSKLAGDEIPITARVLNIADAYDSMRCSRPYRPALSRDAARAHISKLSGIQFDPNLVQIFLKSLAGFESEVEAKGLYYADSQESAEPRANGDKNAFLSQIKLANREAFTLYEMARAFGGTVKIGHTLELFTTTIREFVPFETCAVFLVDDSKRYADAVHVVGDNADRLASKRIRIGEGASGVALKTRESVRNVNPDLDFSLEQISLVHEYSTMISLPLVFDGNLIGAVSVYSRELSRYHDEHLRILETISRIAADAIGKSQQHNEAKAHALTDPMTNLPNARSLKLQFERETARADRSEASLHLIMMDLDGFKAVNDTHGHKVGDRVLFEVGRVIQKELREYDFLARYGGDEFVALVSSANTVDVHDLCNRIEKAVTDLSISVEAGGEAKVGVSVGAAEFGVGAMTLDALVAAADRAMYVRKTRRKRDRAVQNIDSMYVNPSPSTDVGSADALIVELNDSHILSSASVN